ncbi:MAG: hypothetical protein K2K30_00135 [Alistipes sp.]|nr:hypothetical protein [Alistipes sp.]
MNLKTHRAAALVALSATLLAGCESGNDENNHPGAGGRKITEIVGVFNHPNYSTGISQQYQERQLFTYDNEGRLDRWVCTASNGSSSDLQCFYESDSHISVFGTRLYEDGEESVVAEIDLNAAGKVTRITDLDDHDQTYYYSNGLLSHSVDERGYTMSYTWTNGDLTAIRVDPSPYGSSKEYIETAGYGSTPNIANLDLNHLLAYPTEYYAVMFGNGLVGDFLGAAGMFGRSAHYITTSSDQDFDIEWTFDAAGYPTELHVVYWWDSKIEMEIRYTIYYND